MSAFDKLLKVQSEVRAPKDAYNSFGKYSYRSCESILEAVKPILAKHKATIFITDNIHHIESKAYGGGRTYVEATVNFVDIEDGSVISVTASAREADTKKGMDEAQITGAASSYARKYALAGLLLLDDNKDADGLKGANEKITEHQAQILNQYLDEYEKKGGMEKAKVLTLYKVKETKELTGANYADILRRIGVKDEAV